MTDTDGNAQDKAQAVSMCCDAPVGEIEIDGIDGPEGFMIPVATAECSECGHMSGVHDVD